MTEKDNSLVYSVNIWLFSILLPTTIATWFLAKQTARDWGEFFEMFFSYPLLLGAFTLPLHLAFVFGVEGLYKMVRKEFYLRVIVHGFALLLGIVILMVVIRLDYFLIDYTKFWLAFQISLISYFVWKLEIKRPEYRPKKPKQKIRPTREDILDDDLSTL